jgi:hypothetical protein
MSQHTDPPTQIPTSPETHTVPASSTRLQDAAVSLLPKDHYDTIIMTGVIAGIGYYLCTKDTWLLVTFLGLLTGGAIEKSRQLRRGRR